MSDQNQAPHEKCTGGGGPRGLPEHVLKVLKFAAAEMFTLKIFSKIKLIIYHSYSKKIYADSYVQYPLR